MSKFYDTLKQLGVQGEATFEIIAKIFEEGLVKSYPKQKVIKFLVEYFIRTQKIKLFVDEHTDEQYFAVVVNKGNLINHIDEVNKIVNHINNLIQEKIAPIKGLVLVGGKSTRMGQDKSELNYFGKPQKEFAKELLENNNFETYYSVQNKSEKENEISDKFLNLGPFGGICSAFQKDPNAAWLVLATDVPFVNDEVIKLLLQKRNSSKLATAIKGKSNQFVEPLITIYEPKAYSVLLQYLAQGYSCPRKVLINSDVEIVEVDEDLIRNINTPDEYKAAKKELDTL